MLHLAFVYANRRERLIELLDHAHLAEFGVMLDKLKRLFDDRVDIDRELFCLALVREFEQAVCDRLAPERFIANDL